MRRKLLRIGPTIATRTVELLVVAVILGSRIVQADNIAGHGFGILGINGAIDENAGTSFFHAGTAAAINDGDLTTHVDNYYGAVPGGDHGQTNSFTGILWGSSRYETINNVILTMALFDDGGWFGISGTGPSAGNPLPAEQLLEPTVQITTNHGITWETVLHTSDYVAVMSGQGTGGGGNPNPINAATTFTFSPPLIGINGIRIIGQNGGTSDGNGFIGVAEIEVNGDADIDTDGDGLPDGWETANRLTVGTNDATADADGDGLTNAQEYAAGSNPKVVDTDGDGLSDGSELNVFQTSPYLVDSDKDGLADGNEVSVFQTDPTLMDTDGDGLTDGNEALVRHTDPTLVDSDGDRFGDGLEVAQGSDPMNPSNFPNNYANIGTGIMGTKAALNGGPHTEVTWFHAGLAESIVDGIPTTRVDTYNGGSADTVSFVGVIWDHALTTPILKLELTLATFVDGGWFGINGTGPAAGAALSLAHLAEPQVQVSTDNGTTWTTVEDNSDYASKLTGHIIGGGPAGNPTAVKATFTLTTPAEGLSGIRIIGSEGGTASRGFLGVFELAVIGEVADSDSDGMDDSWERKHDLIVGTNDASEDLDADGLTNIREFHVSTDPQTADSDDDGLIDGLEANQLHTNPLLADTDSDTLWDGVEVSQYRSNPLSKDSDGDGFPDGFEVAQGSDPSIAASMPNNIAPLGIGILGTKRTVATGPETLVLNAGGDSSINDGNLTTRVDSLGGGSDTASFVGIRWEVIVSDPIVSLDLTLATFVDGGWFGPNNVTPGSGGKLTPDHLIEPKIQITTDHGINWNDIAATSDYLTALEGHSLPEVNLGAPTAITAHFQLSQPQSRITGIRIIGSEGGTASGGFLGVFDLAVYVSRGPQPPGAILHNITKVSGQMHFEFDSKTGVTHMVQFKNSLNDGNWQTLMVIEGDGSRKKVNDPATGTARFYRAITP